MGLIWLVLAAIGLWALIRLGRQTEGPRRGHWRVAGTILSAVMIAGAVVAAARGAFLIAAALGAAGVWLVLSSRVRIMPPRAEAMGEAEARAVLGVGPAAEATEINAAWRRLMARAHPDQGGTEGLAARLNAARDRLLKSSGRR